MRHASGFTLVELIMTIAMIGVLTVAISPAFEMMSTARTAANVERQKLNNERITRAMYRFAKFDQAVGRLPPPYTSAAAKLYSAVYNPAGATAEELAFRDRLLATNLSTEAINDDGRAAENMRVYQRVGPLTLSVPAYIQTGPVVSLTYEFGVVYMTNCRYSDATCNKAARPGASPEMDATGTAPAVRYDVWTTTAPDYGESFVSTLPIQKEKLAQTMRRIDAIRDKLTDFYNYKQLSAAAGDTTNFYPTDSDGSTDLSGSTPGTNQGCYDGWYDLSDGTIDVLAQVGLSANEFGVTAWGGSIEYCRKYDPLAQGESTAPHYAALRIAGSVLDTSAATWTGRDPVDDGSDVLFPLY